MDSRTLLRRTPAGDAEVARPANGLSITQRRILTLLDAPEHLDEMPLRAGLDGERLQREAARLAKAGLIACEMHVDPEHAIAANAGVLRRSPMSFMRSLAVLAVLAFASALVWTGWRFTAPPAASERTRESVVTDKPVAAPAAPTSVEPSVIATRVLRGNPRPAPAAPPPNAAADAASAGATVVNAEPRAEP